MTTTHTITINGESHQTQHDHVLALLEELHMTKGRFAVEIDQNLVAKHALASTPITDGMSIEVVQAVGGG